MALAPGKASSTLAVRGGLGRAAHILAAGTASSNWRDRPARWGLGQPTAPKDLSWTLPRASRGRNPKRRQRHAQSARHRILRRLTAKLRLGAPLRAPSRVK